MKSSAAAPQYDPYAALRLPEYRRFLLARICLTVATQVQGVVVSWQIFQLTKDPLALGLIGLAEAIPSIVVSLYAGHVADSVRRKNIIVTAMAVMFGCSLTLLLLTSPAGVGLLAHEALKTLPIYLVIFVSGIA
ncbi:MAG TPA: MFS transporter, partial [Hymenobacter sp.]